MPFWSGEALEERLPDLIRPFDSGAIDCAAYTLRVGHEVYISPDREIAEPSRHTKKTLSEGQGFAIPPGQFGFLCTAERIKVPENALAFISIKARLKFSGLINISGFHVDPGCEGALLFSVMNAGPKPLHLEQGQPLFLIWYADLDRVTERKKQPKDGFTGIDTDQINKISGEILSLQSPSDKQRALEHDIDRQLEAQNSKISNLTLMVNLFLTAAIAIAGGLIVWGVTEWIG
jgi:dCTP deaminase